MVWMRYRGPLFILFFILNTHALCMSSFPGVGCSRELVRLISPLEYTQRKHTKKVHLPDPDNTDYIQARAPFQPVKRSSALLIVSLQAVEGIRVVRHLAR